jgi:hypothetical protein
MSSLKEIYKDYKSKSNIFLKVTSHTVTEVDRLFAVMYCLYLQGTIANQTPNRRAARRLGGMRNTYKICN